SGGGVPHEQNLGQGFVQDGARDFDAALSVPCPQLRPRAAVDRSLLSRRCFFPLHAAADVSSPPAPVVLLPPSSYDTPTAAIPRGRPGRRPWPALTFRMRASSSAITNRRELLSCRLAWTGARG
ncbi:unnamed protein product, partial [Ectocarpus fasciculatus]